MKRAAHFPKSRWNGKNFKPGLRETNYASFALNLAGDAGKLRHHE
ncbi:MAG: hypothetical protein WDM76_18600 [Limisphaerales bacterium]